MSASLSPAKKAAMEHLSEMNDMSADLERKDSERTWMGVHASVVQEWIPSLNLPLPF